MIDYIMNFIVPPVYGQCPICVITVGGGLLLAKKLGIDDLLVSIWLSGLNTAIAIWITTKIKNKLWNNPYFMTVIFYAVTMVYLILSKQIGHPGNVFLGIDKVVFGITLGLIVSLFSFYIDQLIRGKNNKKVLFPYQKVIIPVSLLALITLIFKILIK